VKPNAPAEARCKASPPAGCSVWPCPTCGAKDWEDAGNKCRGEWVCSADDQRQIDCEREQSTPNTELCARLPCGYGIRKRADGLSGYFLEVRG
jgi:hypothetical protein